MLTSDFRTALRSLSRRRGYSALHLTGLGVGLACCLLIGLFVRDELRYDRFHSDGDRIVRLMASGTFDNGFDFSLGGLPSGAAMDLMASRPEVEVTTQMSRPQSRTVHHDGERTEEGGFVYVDEHFFDVFNFDLIAGDVSAMDRSGVVLLTQTMAQRYFPGGEALGSKLLLNATNGPEVVGIVADPPKQSSLRFQALLTTERNADWYAGGNPTYARLQSVADTATVVPYVEAALVERLDGFISATVEAMPLTDLYLNGQTYASDYSSGSGLLRGKASYVWAFGAAALLILFVSCITYVTLATAQAAERASEIGVRKALGGSRGQLARQFVIEAAVLTTGALVVAAILAHLALPGLNALTDKSLVIDYLGDPFVALLFASVGVGVTLLCGLYPAVYLSSFRPIEALNSRSMGVGRGARTRRILVTTQFAVSVGLLLCAVTMSRQLDFLADKELGFAGDQLVRVEMIAQERYDAFKAELLALPGVRGVTTAPSFPNTMSGWYTFDSEEPDAPADDTFDIMETDADFPATFGTPVAAGRYFESGRPADSASVVLSAAGARSFGWTPNEAVGKTIGEENMVVIGVLADLHGASLDMELRPSLYRLTDERRRTVYLRIDPQQASATLDAVATLYPDFNDFDAFDYTFLDDAFASFFASDQRLRTLISVFTLRRSTPGRAGHCRIGYACRRPSDARDRYSQGAGRERGRVGAAVVARVCHFVDRRVCRCGADCGLGDADVARRISLPRRPRSGCVRACRSHRMRRSAERCGAADG